MKRSMLALMILSTVYVGHSQTTINFCGSVDPNGYCYLNNNKFFFSPDSTRQRIFMEVKDASSFASTAKIVFRIYSIALNGEEKLSSSSEQNVQPSWMFAWFPHIFESVGKYKVKVYNDKDALLCSKELELFAH